MDAALVCQFGFAGICITSGAQAWNKDAAKELQKIEGVIVYEEQYIEAIGNLCVISID